jgi:hypothetical protein
MRRDPYRHSVWIDVFGVVLVGAILLGGVGYLLFQAGGAAGGVGTDLPRGGGVSSPAQSSRLARPSRPSDGARVGGGTSHPLLSSRSRSAPSGTAAPFSEGWRADATPSLTGPSASSGQGSPGSAGGAAPNLSGTSGSSSGSAKRFGSGGARHGDADRPAGASWRAEARQLGGQARALSSQLGQMAQRDGRGTTEQSSSQEESGGAETASARTSSQNVPNPPSPSVPIDDHLHWLLVAGVLWGAWRIWRGG